MRFDIWMRRIGGRRARWGPIWLAIACAVAPACTPAAERSASIVLIIIDTLRADKLGAYGFADCSSPEIDAYAARGVRFGRAFAQSSWTTPSIGSMLTSLYPRTLAIFDATRDTLGLQYETLSEVLHAAGYQTLGATANPNINGTFHFNQGFDQYFDSDWDWDWSPDEKQQVRFHTAPEILNRVLRWIDDHPFDGPRYVQVNLMDVHQSFEVVGGQARPTPVPLIERAKRSWSEWRCDRSRPKSFDWTQLQEQPYVDAITRVSREIDSFIVELESRPDWRDTLFVITSDHGEGLFDHPDVYNSNRHGRLLYESQLWVPWILYSTSGDLPEGRVVEQRVRLLDLMPTLLDYAGVAGPKEMAGTSLMPLLEDEPRSVTLPDFFVAETTFRGSDKAALLTKDWNYIENYDQHPGTNAIALHPATSRQNGTRTDVAEQHADVVRLLRAKLDQWKRDHPKGTPVPLGLHGLGDDETRQLEQLGYLDPKSP